VKHWRDTRDGGHALTDERDIYELLANMAARRVRACLEEVIDADVVSAAVDQCRLTLKSGEKTPLADRAVQMVSAFAEYGVTQAMIELRLGNKLDAVSENQLASLRRVYKSLKDGVGKREDFFKPEPSKPEFYEPTGPSSPGAPEPTHPEDGYLGPQTNPMANDLGAGARSTSPNKQTPDAPDQISGFNPLKSLRGLLSMAKVKEGEYMDWLAATGATDDSYGSLEELVMSKGQDFAKFQCDNWPATAAKILAAKKKGKA
jgi:hypothetical protein